MRARSALRAAAQNFSTHVTADLSVDVKGVRMFENRDKTVLFADVTEGTQGWAQLQSLYGMTQPGT